MVQGLGFNQGRGSRFRVGFRGTKSNKKLEGSNVGLGFRGLGFRV